MKIRRQMAGGLVVFLLLFGATGTASASVSHDGWGLGIAEDETNWSSPTTFPALGEGFARLRPKVFRLQTIWNTMGPEASQQAWKARTHAMIAQAKAQGAAQVTLTLRSNSPGNVGPAGYFPSATQYKTETDALVKEFAGEVDFWGPANEPNGAWRPKEAPGGQAALDPTYLAAYYLKMRESVAAYDPAGKVTSPDFLDSSSSYGSFSAYISNYLSHVPAGNDGGWGVAAAWHPYAGVASASLASTTTFTGLVTTGQPIWVTEVGSRADLVGQSTQNTQVNWIINTLGAQARVTRVFYYQMPGHASGWDSGLLNTDSSPRPAWYTWCAASHNNNAADLDCQAPEPAAVSPQPGRYDVFVRGSDGGLWHKFVANGSWSGWESLGGGLGSDPVAVSIATGTIDVFVRGTDGALYRINCSGSCSGGAWSSWQWVPNSSLIGKPAVISSEPGRLDVFARGAFNQIYHVFKLAGGGWSGWNSIGGETVSSPAAISLESGRGDVFWRGTDGKLWRRFFSPGVGWAGPESIEGWSLASSPTVISSEPGRIDVFSRGTDNQLWHVFKPKVGAWSKPGSLGTPPGVSFVGRPSAISAESGRADVFLRGNDNQIWHRFFPPSGGWSSWGSIGGTLLADPAVISPEPGRLDVFDVGSDFQFYQRFILGFNSGGNWGNWGSIGEP
jgi:Glycosyl hydrolase catalytic core